MTSPPSGPPPQNDNHSSSQNNNQTNTIRPQLENTQQPSTSTSSTSPSFHSSAIAVQAAYRMTTPIPTPGAASPGSPGSLGSPESLGSLERNPDTGLGATNVQDTRSASKTRKKASPGYLSPRALSPRHRSPNSSQAFNYGSFASADNDFESAAPNPVGLQGSASRSPPHVKFTVSGPSPTALSDEETSSDIDIHMMDEGTSHTTHRTHHGFGKSSGHGHGHGHGHGGINGNGNGHNHGSTARPRYHWLSRNPVAGGGTGDEPGVDVKSKRDEEAYAHLKGACHVTVVDYSSNPNDTNTNIKVDFEGSRLSEFLNGEEGERPLGEDGKPSGVRWIHVEGLNWEVIKVLTINFGLHPLAVEDALRSSNSPRSKMDFYKNHLYLQLLVQHMHPADDLALSIAAEEMSQHKFEQAWAASHSAEGGDAEAGFGSGQASALDGVDSEYSIGGERDNSRGQDFGRLLREGNNAKNDTPGGIGSEGSVTGRPPGPGRFGHRRSSLGVPPAARNTDWSEGVANRRGSSAGRRGSTMTGQGGVLTKMKDFFGGSQKVMKLPEGVEGVFEPSIGDSRLHDGSPYSKAAHRLTIDHLSAKYMVPVRRGIISTFMLRDGTLITVTRRPNAEVLQPIYARLEDESSLLRRSGDVSMLAEALLDTSVDLAIEISQTFEAEILKLEASVLVDPQMETVRHLHVLSSQLIRLRRSLTPLLHLIYIIRDQDQQRSAAATVMSQPSNGGGPRPGDRNHYSRDSPWMAGGESLGPSPLGRSGTPAPGDSGGRGCFGAGSRSGSFTGINTFRDSQAAQQQQQQYLNTPENKRDSLNLGMTHSDSQSTKSTATVVPGSAPLGMIPYSPNAASQGGMVQTGFFSPMTKVYVGDVIDHLEIIVGSMDQFVATCDHLTDYVFNVLSFQTNASMERLSIVTVIFLPLTFISSYFGMNFTEFDQINGPVGYFWKVAIPCTVGFFIIFSFSYLRSGATTVMRKFARYRRTKEVEERIRMRSRRKTKIQ